MDQVELLRRVIEVLETQGVMYMLVGSFASAAYGEPRLTHDIDVVVQLSREQADRLCLEFPAPEFYVSSQAVDEAVLANRPFNVIHTPSANKIDFVVARQDAWGLSQLARRQRRPVLPGCLAYVAAPEDVILGKLWYYDEGGSEKHLRDSAAILQVSGDDVDRNYIEHWASQLGLVEAWQAVLKRLA